MFLSVHQEACTTVEFKERKMQNKTIGFRKQADVPLSNQLRLLHSQQVSLWVTVLSSN
jgi:hypothetical protein